MTDPAPTTDPVVDPSAGATPPADPPADPTNPPASDPSDAGAANLGDAGKKALDAMKAKWKEAEAKAKAQESELAALKAQAEGKEAEHKLATEAQRIKDEALAAANDRIKKAEVRALAASKLADPADALKFLDLSEFEVDSDGEVDASQIARAIDDLIAEKPYLAAQGGKRFTGSADGGARNESAGLSQLSRDDMSRMGVEEIAKATDEGRFDKLLGRK